MTCCADDIRFLGFVCKYKGYSELKETSVGNGHCNV